LTVVSAHAALVEVDLYAVRRAATELTQKGLIHGGPEAEEDPIAQR